MATPTFKLIQGGLHSSIPQAQKRFVSAYVTNTRLMGVLAIYAHWSVKGGGDIHQFFYIDCEETGLETCTVYRGDWNREMQMAEQALVGGLGAEKLPLTAKALRWLLGHWRKFNLRRGLPLPANKDNYAFIFEKTVKFSRDEQADLMRRICGEIWSDYQVVNYFLMRCVGRDYPGAAYLAKDGVPLDLFADYEKATFCKNIIDRAGRRPGEYICESLVEMNGRYEQIITKVTVDDLKVTGTELCSIYPITETEAAMMLKKTEYVTVYELLMDGQNLEENLGEFVLNMNTVMTVHPNGRLFMAFKPTNAHVAERVFMLSNDVQGVYFLTNNGQLIACAYDFKEIIAIERALGDSPLKPYLVMTAQYELLDPVLFEFINSTFPDFQGFISPLE